jgi:hypothetical protein
MVRVLRREISQNCGRNDRVVRLNETMMLTVTVSVARVEYSKVTLLSDQ